MWAEGIKADLVPVLPELKQFFKFAESSEYLNKVDVKRFIEVDDALNPELKHGLSPKDAWAVDSKIWGLLHNLTRSHDIACLKIKNENDIESGTLAWHNLKSFFKEEDEEYCHDVLASALSVTKCTSLSQLQSQLDQWLNRKAKAIKLKPEYDIYFDNTTTYTILKRLVPDSIEHTLRTNKQDFPTYDKALKYVQQLLQRMYEKSHPIPMDVDAIKQKHVSFEDDHDNHEHKQNDDDDHPLLLLDVWR